MNALALVTRARALLVDLDGTLVDSQAPVQRVWTAFAQRHHLDPAHVHSIAQGRPSRETIRLLLPAADQAAEAEAEAQAVEQAEINDPDGIRALPGATDLLAGSRRLAIVTSCSTALAGTRLRAAGLPIPAVLVSCDDVERGKPDPACFVLGARQLGLAPERCVVIEDAPAGIAAGRAAGAQVIALRTTHADRELRGAHAIVDDLAALTTPG